jgi:hypothetical protein
MKNPRYYALLCYPSTGFPKFIDSFKTLALARSWAAQAIRDGYCSVEILRDQAMPSGYFGIERDLIDTIQA